MSTLLFRPGGRRVRWFLLGLTAAAVAASVVALTPLRIGRRYRPLIKPSPSELPPQPPGTVAIVFGAGWSEQYGLPDVSVDRVATGAELYRTGRVGKLLLSSSGAGEVGAMRAVALDAGVPDADIILDFDSYRTYDSCYRARRAFGIDRAVLVTQQFHLPRALYLCDSLGVVGVGVAADRRRYFKDNYPAWRTREFLASVRAWMGVNFLRPSPRQSGIPTTRP